ncbi:helix-turn-helix transcriptional regulator [Flammeovirgaceae bacterium SG7u.111]|nr:helix-turn-helix transcriptional regulator [Flammeovirgaceae bacterium SG7u.132]WPO36027.1 helix-turn-helix transcriptional regulator [Flammeovirgaceae bacterium SG7u.111]
MEKENKGLGEFEELVLLAVCILEGEGYGISVKKEVEKHSGRSILLGAVHITLYRLQDKGLLTSEMGGKSEKRGDRKKRLFKITDHGMRQLHAAQDVRLKMWQLIPPLKPSL